MSELSTEGKGLMTQKLKKQCRHSINWIKDMWHLWPHPRVGPMGGPLKTCIQVSQKTSSCKLFAAPFVLHCTIFTCLSYPQKGSHDPKVEKAAPAQHQVDKGYVTFDHIQLWSTWMHASVAYSFHQLKRRCITKFQNGIPLWDRKIWQQHLTHNVLQVMFKCASGLPPPTKAACAHLQCGGRAKRHQNHAVIWGRPLVDFLQYKRFQRVRNTAKLQPNKNSCLPKCPNSPCRYCTEAESGILACWRSMNLLVFECSIRT